MNKPSYIRIASDLHLEAFSGKPAGELINAFLPANDKDEDSILCLAGDISSHPPQLEQFFTELCHRFAHVVYIPGNHEYYRKNYQEYNAWLANLANRLHIYNLDVASSDVNEIRLENVRVIFGTLWADGGATLSEEENVAFYLNDFRLIKYEKRMFTVSDMKLIHVCHRQRIEHFLKQPFDSGKTVVVTHHLPSYSLCHPRFGTDCNGGFASHCDRLIHEDFAPDIWVYGHTHDTQDNVIGKTRVICNPAGYRGEWGSSFNHFHPLFIQL